MRSKAEAKMAGGNRKAENRDPTTRHADRVLAALGARAAVPTLEYRSLLGKYHVLLDKFHRVMTISDTYSAELKSVTEQLDQLRSLALPICMFCKKIRVDDTYWEQIEGYFISHLELAFSHGICPDCMEERYGSYLETPQVKARIEGDVRALAGRSETGNVPDEDEAVRAAEDILAYPNAPPGRLRGGLRRLADRYRRLLRRMGKILLISDSYQARLMELNARLGLLAHTDSLTGISNRRDAMEKLEEERSRAERHGGVFSIAIADVDDFKAVNDAYGHEAGDRLLAALGRVLRTAIRREDTCARWGGEEFLFLLPEAGPGAVDGLVRKVLASVKALEVPYQKAVLRCTFSVGCVSSRPDRSVDELLREADAALYEAKRRGKDQVVSADTLRPE